ncbi:hypothetical protein MMC12_005753 [Toensbergia leucococca]|nr:hypothetical protein [Toensbergia leucococca]
MTARDKMVLSNLRHLSDLQVLKMRKTNLRDIDIDILADAVGIRVRSLDIRGNFLTDKSVRTLLNNCFLSSDDNDRLMDARGHSLPDLVVEDWPLGIIRPDPHLLDEFRGEDFNDLLVKRLTKGIVSRLPCEDLPQSGITHLYIADNHLTVESLSSLVKSERLHVLDAGVVNTAKVLARPRAVSLSSMGSKDREIALPGVEKLTPVLKAHASRNLTYLRMSHVVVTQKAPSLGKQPPSAAHELSSDNQKFELDATEPVFELAAEASNPRYELPGDSIHVVLSPAINEKPSLSFEEQSRAYVRRGSAFAPEAVNLDESEDDQTPVLTATGLGRMAQAINGINSPTDAEPIGLIAQKPLAINEVPELSITLIEEQRRALRSRMRERHGLLPGMLPNLRTLVLVGVPCYDDSYRVIDTLIHFIRDCAAETELADIQASLQPKILHLPGRTQSTQSGRLSEIFALRCIVLEMAPPNSSLRRETNFTPQASKFAHRTKSSTEDMDSEAFWSASTNDFSFFDKEEECGLPAKEPILHFPLSTLSEKMALSVNSLESESAPILQQSRNGENEVDVVKELSKFRRGRKAAYENAIKAGRKHAEGYWSGEVKIVRWQGGDGYRHGSVACYGNVYENGMYR